MKCLCGPLSLCLGLGLAWSPTLRGETTLKPGEEDPVSLTPATDLLVAVERARNYYRNCEDQYGAEHPSTLRALYSLAYARELAGLYADSEKDLRIVWHAR